MGASFVNEILEKTTASISDVFKAYFIVQEIFDLRNLWQRAEEIHAYIGSTNQLKSHYCHLATSTTSRFYGCFDLIMSLWISLKQ